MENNGYLLIFNCKEKKMKKIGFGIVTVIFIATLIAGFSYAQQSSQSGQGGWHGSSMMGKGGQHGSMMMRQGRGTGPGGWYCPWMGDSGHHYGYNNQGGQPLTQDQAKQMLQNHIQGNPYLKVGEFTDKGDFYDVTIVTKKEGALVEKIQVDKKTGWFRNVP
jgi:hypothetical protein